MEGQCNIRQGAEEAEGGRRERSEQMTTTRTLQIRPVWKTATLSPMWITKWH